jgi:hypothetical protein
MSILRTKSLEMFNLRGGFQTVGGFMPPGVYKIAYDGEPARFGDLPADIAKVVESYNGPMPADVDVFDVAKYQRDLENHARLAATTPAQPEKLTRTEIEKKYGWPAGTCERAELFGFPKSTGWKINPQGQQRSLYIAAHVEKWAAAITELAEILRVR